MTKLTSEAEVVRALAERVMLKAPPNSESMAHILKTWDPLCSVADAHELLERFSGAGYTINRHSGIFKVRLYAPLLAASISTGEADTFCLAAVRAALASIGFEYEPSEAKP